MERHQFLQRRGFRVTGRKLVVQFTAGIPELSWAAARWSTRRPKGGLLRGVRRAPCGKNIVAAGLATRCSVQLAYAIGITDPFSIYVNTFGTGKIPDDRLEKLSGICLI